MNDITERDERPASEHAVVDALLREQLGGAEPPALADAVLARHRRGEGRAVDVRDPRPAAPPRWLAAAIALAGLGAVLGALLLRRPVPAPAPVQQPQPGPQSRSQSESQSSPTVDVTSLDELRRLLPKTTALRIEPWYQQPSMVSVPLAPPRQLDGEPALRLARALADDVREEPTAGWRWAHRLQFVLDDQRTIEVGLDRRDPGCIGVHGLHGDARIPLSTADLLLRELDDAARALGIVTEREHLDDPRLRARGSLVLAFADDRSPLTEAELDVLAHPEPATSLDLRGIPMLVDARVLAAVARGTSWERLVLDGCDVDDDELRPLGTLPKLCSLSLQRCTRLSGEAFCRRPDGAGGSVLPFAALTSLDVSGCSGLRRDANGRGLTRNLLPTIVAQHSLRILRLADAALPDDDASWQRFAAETKVTLLDLSGHQFAPALLRRIAGIASVTVLRLQLCGLHDRDLDALAAAKQLGALDLGGNPELTIEGLQPLVDRLPGLRLLGLNGCVHVTDPQRRALEGRGLRIVDTVGGDLR